MYWHQKKYSRLIWFPLFSLLALTALLTACAQEDQGNTAESTIQAISATPGSSSSTTNSSTPSTVPLTAIRMLDASNGWAMTAGSILKTTDGGQSWTDITPVNAGLNTASQGDFVDAQHAWIATPTAPTTGKSVVVLRTTNGGANWQSTTINDANSVSIDMPHFLGTQQGWLQLVASPGAGSAPTDLWHSSDGGVTWQQVNKSGSQMPYSTGLSFADAQNAVQAGNVGAYASSNSVPGVSVTHDGGHTWKIQLLALPTGVTGSSVSSVETTPPVFFGTTALLPVYVSLTNGQSRFDLYRSSNDGSIWSQTTIANIKASAVYVLNQNDVWATDSDTGKLFYTTNGGTGWSAASSTAYGFTALSFVSPTNGWGISKNGFFITSDSGKTWTKISYSIS